MGRIRSLWEAPALLDTECHEEAPKRSRPSEERVDQGMLPQLIGYNLRRAQANALQSLQSLMAPYDITPGQFGALYLVFQNPGLSQSDLGAALGIDRSSMVAVIDRLEARGLVVRAPSPMDRRSYALRLSEAGTELVDDLAPQVREHDRVIAHQLSGAEQAALVDLLQRLNGG
jgi:DNA-binding MarR family transcriptional regulator